MSKAGTNFKLLTEVLNIENNPKIYRYNATQDEPNVTETYCSTIRSNPNFSYK